jgi:hypothetical protein
MVTFCRPCPVFRHPRALSAGVSAFNWVHSQPAGGAGVLASRLF